MINACICTIGDEILIGQVVDTNSSRLAVALEEAGLHVSRMLSIGDDKKDIRETLRRELRHHAIVITTGGLGPTKDDITKGVLARLSGSTGYVEHAGQLKVIRQILASRGLDMLPSNQAQALVPDTCTVIPNKLGTAPGMAFHRSVMVYGLAESALAARIAPWEDALPEGMHLAYLPNPLTGVRLRLSVYGCDPEEGEARIQKELEGLQSILGDLIYSLEDSTLEETLGGIFKAHGLTVSAAESCTGGEIAHLFTSVPGSSAYFLGSVTSYAIPVKEKVLGVPGNIIEENGVVSSEVAAAMAEGVRRLTGSDYSVATTGLAGPSGDEHNPVGTVWVGVAGPHGTKTARFQFKNDRKRNIERFSASALDFLRTFVLADLNN